MTAKENMSDSQLVDALKALQASIRAIQVMKDEVQLIISATGDSLDASSAIKRIEVAREKMFVSYEDEMPNLDEWEARMTHRSKVFNVHADGALDGETAIRKISEKHYDVISVDYNMDHSIDGASLIMLLRKKQLVDESTTAIIAITSISELGGNAFRELGVPQITLPLHLQEVASVIRRELKRIGRIQE